jgi:hypothetical protein
MDQLFVESCSFCDGAACRLEPCRHHNFKRKLHRNISDEHVDEGFGGGCVAIRVVGV